MPLGIPISTTSGGAWATAGSPNYLRDMMAMTAQDVQWAQEMDKFYAGLELSEKRLEEQTRQYDVSFEEQVRQSDLRLGEMRREYDLSYGLEKEQFEQEKFKWEEEFAKSQERWETEQESAQEQWDAYYEKQRFTQEQEAARWEEERETMDLQQSLLQQAVDVKGRGGEVSPVRREGESQRETLPTVTSGASLWDRLAQWSAMGSARDLISQQKEEATDYLYPRSYGPDSVKYGAFEEEREEYRSPLAEGRYDYTPY